MKVRAIRHRAKTKFVSIGGFLFIRDCAVKRCRTYEMGCISCAFWRFRDEHGRFAYDEDEMRGFYNKVEDERVETLLKGG
jgi:hypothetical protein